MTGKLRVDQLLVGAVRIQQENHVTVGQRRLGGPERDLLDVGDHEGSGSVLPGSRTACMSVPSARISQMSSSQSARGSPTVVDCSRRRSGCPGATSEAAPPSGVKVRRTRLYAAVHDVQFIVPSRNELKLSGRRGPVGEENPM